MKDHDRFFRMAYWVKYLKVLHGLIQSRCSGKSVPIYTYNIVNTYPHDRQAFTEGLAFENGFIYEGTGLYGNSSVRKVALETGEVLQISKLSSKYFGEGITIFKDTIIQLTWRSNVGFVYDKNSFQLLHRFYYTTEGWGITNDGVSLIMSNGTSVLQILDSLTFRIIGYLEVRENNIPVNRINALEYIDSKLYANIWQTEKIAIIEPHDGHVIGWVDLSGITGSHNAIPHDDVLNGIAYDKQTGRLFVTRKLWPLLYEITLTAKE